MSIFREKAAYEVWTAYTEECPEKPLLGLSWIPHSEEINQPVWDLEQQLFKTPYDRAVLFVIYLLRDEFIAEDAKYSETALARYTEIVMRHFDINFEARHKKEYYNRIIHPHRDLETALRGVPDLNRTTRIVQFKSHDYWRPRLQLHLYFSVDALDYIRVMFTEKNRGASLTEIRREMIDHIITHVQSVVDWQPEYIRKEKYEKLSDSPKDWLQFYSLIAQKIYRLPAANAYNTWWKEGYAGARRFLKTINWELRAVGLSVQDFGIPGKTVSISQFYRIFICLIMNILPPVAHFEIDKRIEDDYMNDPTCLPKVLELIGTWESYSSTNPCWETALVRSGLDLGLPLLPSSTENSPATWLSFYFEDPNCKLLKSRWDPWKDYTTSWKNDHKRGQALRCKAGIPSTLSYKSTTIKRSSSGNSDESASQNKKARQ
ncbi:hypothetical protein TRVA0_021S02102 [Trichomonascus vanleenenianus]|uniref:uncharacterized protein n=1 Tax=Trichomonascus vanleenenianus TaxID=2268995 RepID=UPI003ECB343F